MAMEETARPIYDTYAAIRRLTEAGLPEPHAEAVVREQVHLIEHDLATKADIAAVRGDVEKLAITTKADIAAVRGDVEKLAITTKADIAAVRGDVEKLAITTKADIEASKNDVIKWVASINTATAVSVAAVVIAAIKLL